jgi:hypothetical protein
LLLKTPWGEVSNVFVDYSSCFGFGCSARGNLREWRAEFSVRTNRFDANSEPSDSACIEADLVARGARLQAKERIQTFPIEETRDEKGGDCLESVPITGGPQPHTAVLDAAHHRLFMGSRLGGGHVVDPGSLWSSNTDTGKVAQALDAVGGADEIFYDAPTSRIYFSGSSGTLAVFHEDDPDHFRMLGKVPTGSIAKSGVWIPEMKRYYSSVPKHLVQLMPTTQYGTGDRLTEESHLMVFEEIP